MRAILLAGVLLFAGCAMPVKKPEAKDPENGFFSQWKQENTTNILDLTRGTCEAPFLAKFVTGKGAVCNCRVDCKGGSKKAGAATFSGCVYHAGSADPDEDPGCHTLNADYAYASVDGKLSLTESRGKVTTTYQPNQK